MSRSPEFKRNLGILAIALGLGTAGVGINEARNVINSLENQRSNLPPPTTADLEQAEKQISQLEQEINRWLQQGKPLDEFPSSPEIINAYNTLVQEQTRESLDKELSWGPFPASEKGIPSLSILGTGIASVVWGLRNLFKKNRV